MYIDQLNGCCGVGEISSLHDYNKKFDALTAMEHFCRKFYEVNYDSGEIEPLPSVFIFSEVSRAQDDVQRGYGALFAKLIKKFRLGTVYASPERLNPYHAAEGSKHYCRVYTWTINQRGLERWAKKNNCYPEVRATSEYYYGSNPSWS